MKDTKTEILDAYQEDLKELEIHRKRIEGHTDEKVLEP